jgi:Raf kinase inhibitor-like YbhB/YbcL family protein
MTAVREEGMIPQTKSSRSHFVLKQPLLLTAFLACAGAAIFLWRTCGPAAGQTRATIAVRSADFVNGSSIPRRYTCDGANLSPQLEWQNPPAGAKSFAFVMDDPDAPIDFVHWIVYNIAPGTHQLPEGASPRGSLPAGSQEGANSFGHSEYGGPCPPHGTHRYFFRLYALDLRLDLPPGTTRQQLEAAMNGHVLAQGQLVGTYQRSAH